tara:strand:+ start:2897 stop:3148 length:252 start_codon:yes stop_codon:yes gene_type:complete
LLFISLYTFYKICHQSVLLAAHPAYDKASALMPVVFVPIDYGRGVIDDKKERTQTEELECYTLVSSLREEGHFLMAQPSEKLY